MSFLQESLCEFEVDAGKNARVLERGDVERRQHAVEDREHERRDMLEAALYEDPAPAPAARSSFLPPEDKRGLLTTAILELNRHAPAPANSIPLPKGAPFGAVVLNVQACTLCHACVGVCPTGALSDNPDLPMLRFSRSIAT